MEPWESHRQITSSSYSLLSFLFCSLRHPFPSRTLDVSSTSNDVNVDEVTVLFNVSVTLSDLLFPIYLLSNQRYHFLTLLCMPRSP